MSEGERQIGVADEHSVDARDAGDLTDASEGVPVLDLSDHTRFGGGPVEMLGDRR